MMLFLTLVSTALHLLAGTAILLLSSWFIAACAVAGTGFNYMLPAVVVRALALIRIASGYGQMWLGHKDLTDRITQLRLKVFAGLQNSRSFERAVDADALSYQTEQVAAIWIGWVSHNAGSALSILLTITFSLFWMPQQSEYWLGFVYAFLVIYLILLFWGIRIAHQKQMNQRALLADIDHHVDSVSLWHLMPTVNHPTLKTLAKLESRHYKASQWALTLLQLASAVTLIVMLHFSEVSAPLSPLAMVLPIALLSVGDWLGRLFGDQAVVQNYLISRNKLADYNQEQSIQLRHHETIDTLQLSNFKAANTQMGCIDLKLHEPGLILLSGSSGSGKSRLLQAINGLIPHEGEKKLNDNIIQSGIVDDSIYIEQLPYCLADTLYNNLHLANPKASKRQLFQVLRQLGFANSGLSQWLGQGGRTLSGGEKKRLGVARAALSEAKLILVDEPFEGLETESVIKVAKLLNQMAQGKCVIVASHQFPAELKYHRLINLDDRYANQAVAMKHQQ